MLISDVCLLVVTHCMQSDAIGLWRILETDTFHDEPQTCGGTIPNSNVENLKLGAYKQYLEDHYGSLRERVLELVDERYHRRGDVPPRNQWRYLGIRDPSSREDFIGVWFVAMC